MLDDAGGGSETGRDARSNGSARSAPFNELAAPPGARLSGGPIEQILERRANEPVPDPRSRSWSRRSRCTAQSVNGEGGDRAGRIRGRRAVRPIPDYRVVEGEPRDCPHSPPAGRILAELRDDGFGYWAAETRRDPARWTLRYAGICEVALDRGRRRSPSTALPKPIPS